MANGSPEITLVAAETVEVDGNSYETGQQFICNRQNSVGLILEGRAKIASKQDRPHTDLLKDLSHQMFDAEALGKVWLDPGAIQSFEEKILANGTMRHAYNGKHLNWLHGRRELEAFLWTASDLDPAKLQMLANEFGACLRTKMSRSQVVNLNSLLSDQEKRDEGLVEAETKRHRRIRYLDQGGYLEAPRSARFEYRVVGREWVDYQVALQALEAAPKVAAHEALRDGRILAVKTEGGRSSLIAPSYWNKSTKLHAKSQMLSFLSTYDLPAIWLPSGGQVRGERRIQLVKKIAKALEDEYLRQAPNHVRGQKKAIIKDFAKKFGVPQSVVLAAWDLATLPNWKGQGRPKGMPE